MAYTVVLAETDAHREALARIWKTNSYDPAVNPYARERFDWLYRQAGSRAQTWLAIETGSEAVVGCGSVFRSDRWFRGRRIAAGVPAVFFVEKEHRVAAAALAIQRAVLAGGCRAGFDVCVAKPNRRARPIGDRRLLGYVVFYAMKDGVVVTELLAEEPSGAVLENLLLGFCAQMKREGQVWVSLWYAGGAAFENELARIGFKRGTHQRTLLVYLNPEADAGFRQDMLDCTNWFVFAGEMDVVLSDEVWRVDQEIDAGAANAVAS